MATIALLTRGKVAGRTGPSSAWYEIGRNNALAEALTLRGHRVAMWWDEPHGELLCDSIDLAVLRSGGPLNIERARVLRDSGAVVLNDPDAHWTASDKWATVALLGNAGIAHPRTHLANGPVSAVQVVLKERRSSGGHGVSLVVGADVPDDERFVVQELVAWRDDLRAMVVNGRVEHWLRRRPREGEWRSNLAQGASYESAHDVSPAAEAMALAAAEATELVWCGVDLLQTESGWVILEANPGTTFHGVTREEGEAIVSSVATTIESYL